MTVVGRLCLVFAVAALISVRAGADTSVSLATNYAASIKPAAFAVDHDDDYIYRLPYAEDVSFPIMQGYGASLSHRGTEYYTVDFDMPEGTEVFSAREGEVLNTEDRFAWSCMHSDCDRYSNFVEILHADGTIGKYFHLQAGSVVVRPGEFVERGELLGRSGDTGYSNAPHLHFGVYKPTGRGPEQSVAIRFAVRGGVISRPRKGARYTNTADD